ncbi:MAG: type IV secretory system conjugative DNA transfer family protein [Planctomycetota bacterium]
MDEGRANEGNAFRPTTLDLSKELGSRRPVVVDLQDFGGTLREWVRGEPNRLAILRGLVAGHRARVDADGDLRSSLSSYLLDRLPVVDYGSDEAPTDDERTERVWSALLSIASRHPMVFTSLGLEGELDVRRVSPSADRATYDEAEFWSAMERPRVARAPRALECDPDGARLAREWDLRPMLHPRPEDRATPIPGASPLVEVAEDGSALEPLFGRTLHVPRDVRRRHMLVVGPTGCGKTTRAILPLLRGDLADPDLTVIAIDTKGELLPAVRSFAHDARPGQDVQVVRFRDPQRSLGWNPVRRIRSHAGALALAHQLCHATERGPGSNDSVFWINNSIDLLAGFVLALKRKFGEQASIADALRLCDLPVNELAAFAREFEDLDVLKRFATYLGTGSHNAETIVADLRMRLVLWRDEAVAAVTSADEVDFEELCRRPSALVLQIPEEEVEELRPVTNAWLDQLLATALATARSSPRLELPVQMSIFLEEFASSIGRIPKFERRLNTVRQPGVSLTASVQSIWQIDDEYGSAFRSVMAGFSTKLVFSGCLNEDAAWFSRQAGERTVLETTRTIEEDASGDPLSRPKRIRSERPVVRPLLAPSEIQFAPRNQMLGRAATWFGPDLPPFYVHLAPLYSLEGGGAQLRDAVGLGSRGPLRVSPLLSHRKTLVGGSPTPRPKPVTPQPDGITNTRGWTENDLRAHLDLVKPFLDPDGAQQAARRWWQRFERENAGRLDLVLRVAEEVVRRGAKLDDFYLATAYSGTNNIQANMHYLDYLLAKNKDEARRSEESQQHRERDEAHAEDAARSAREPRDRRDEIRDWVRRMIEERWTYAEAARRSGLTVGTLRYWRRKLAG